MHRALLQHRRKLWAFSCESIFQNLAASLTAEMLTKLFHKYNISLPDANPSKVTLYQIAHKYCHHDTVFTKHLQRYLNRKHAAAIAKFAATEPERIQAEVDGLLAGSSEAMPDTIAGILWAVCSDPRNALRPIEQSLIDELHLRSHCLLLAQFQGQIQVIGPDEPTLEDHDRVRMQQEIQALKTERQALKATMTKLKNQNARLNQAHDLLQREFNLQSERCQALQQRATSQTPASQTVSMRDLKKMQHDAQQLRATIQSQESELKRLRTHLDQRETTATAPEANLPVDPQPMEMAEQVVALPDLQGKRVALIGGRTKSAEHFEATILQMGGHCIRHDGSVKQGAQKLSKVIRQADVVLCPVDCISHGAASSAKRLCRSLEKPCYFLRSSSVTHLRETLQAVAM